MRASENRNRGRRSSPICKSWHGFESLEMYASDRGNHSSHWAALRSKYVAGLLRTYDLGIGSGTRGSQTGRMLEGIEKV